MLPSAHGMSEHVSYTGSKGLTMGPLTRLAHNENPLGASPKAIEAIRRAAVSASMYPDPSGYELKSAIGERFGVGLDNVILGNGSADLIQLLGLALISSDEDEVLVSDPCYPRYRVTARVGRCRLVQVPLNANMKHDLPALMNAVSERTRIVFLDVPHSPTGTIVSAESVRALVARLPPRAAFVLDEAYREFAAGDSLLPDSVELFREFGSVVGLRTFSKAYGLAGVRLGYGFCPAWVARAIEEVREPFNVNAIAQAAGIAALGDQEHVERTVALTHRNMARLIEGLNAIGLNTTSSKANFVLTNLKRPAAPVAQELRARGIATRTVEGSRLQEYLRISVGTEQQVEAVVSELDDILRFCN